MWRHVPARCSSWKRAFSSAFNRAASSQLKPGGMATFISTWNSTSAPHGRDRVQAPRAVAAEGCDAVLVQGHAQAWARGHLEFEVGVGQRLRQDLLGQQQGTEQLRPPGERGEG